MNILVTGGAGYIGSHAVKRLVEQGHRVVAVDNLNRGHAAAVHCDAHFQELDVRATEALATIMRTFHIEAVMHFAALAYVGESVTQPLRYYDNNTGGALSLLGACQAAGVNKLVFSSTCATYGEPDRMPITESVTQRPINPYGWSKLMTERALIDFGHANRDFGFAAPRYFNVAGCAADGTLGEDHDPESHLIPVLLQVALGQRDKAMLFGDDYPTPDGTCIRDYVHVEDLVDAHIATLDALQPGDQRFYNLGIGKGHSVREVIQAVRRVTGHAIPVEVAPRRAGDPPQLYADPRKIETELGWRAKVTEIDAIVQTAWQWFKAHPNGYDD
jgi:UDP-glucose-4-epimerase GalE